MAEVWRRTPAFRLYIPRKPHTKDMPKVKKIPLLIIGKAVDANRATSERSSGMSRLLKTVTKWRGQISGLSMPKDGEFKGI